MKTIRKFIILFVVFVFFALSAFAEYKPIPKHLSKQYRAEMEYYINIHYPKTKNEIENIFIEAEKMYKQVMENPKNSKLYLEFCTSNYDTDTPVFYIYCDLIEITQKYAKFSDDDKPATDFVGTLDAFLEPYFKDNKINKEKLIILSKLSTSKNDLIEKYYSNAHRAVYPEEY